MYTKVQVAMMLFIGLLQTSYGQTIEEEYDRIDKMDSHCQKYMALQALGKKANKEGRAEYGLCIDIGEYANFFENPGVTREYPLYRKDSVDYAHVNTLEFEKEEWLVETAIEKDETQVLFINESHHTSKHRWFITQKLQKLYDKGFRYLASEFVLTPDTSFLYKNGYLKRREKADLYMEEPLFADMIRQATKIGFKIIPFEQEKIEGEREVDSSFVDYGVKVKNGQQMRDWVMAVNLYNRVLKNEHQAKVVVHCGYDHANKYYWEEDFGPMAYYLQQIVKETKVYTVSQAFNMISGLGKFKLHESYATQHPEFKNKVFMIDNRKPENHFIKKTGFVYRKFKKDPQDFYDVYVFHPKEHYQELRT